MDLNHTSEQFESNFRNFSIVELFTLEEGRKCDFNPTLQMKAFYVVMFLITLTIGNFLHFCIIIYEKFGMDSQKRTVTNQLLSSICANLIVYNSLFMLLYTIQRIFELRSKNN